MGNVPLSAGSSELNTIRLQSRKPQTVMYANSGQSPGGGGASAISTAAIMAATSVAGKRKRLNYSVAAARRAQAAGGGQNTVILIGILYNNTYIVALTFIIGSQTVPWFNPSLP